MKYLQLFVWQKELYTGERMSTITQDKFHNDDADLDKKSAWDMCRISLLLKTLLKSKGIIVQRLWLRDSIHCVDKTGVSPRKKGKLKRRVYNVKAPNKLCHIDTNHKLVRCYHSTMVMSHFVITVTLCNTWSTL